MVFGLLIALGLGIFVSPFACAWPVGLDRVAQRLGFRGQEATTRLVTSPMPDYLMPGLGSPALATAVAGGFGTLMAFGLGLALARTLAPKDDPNAAAETP